MPRPPRKNPHAVAMGRKGGKSKSPKKLAALKKNRRKGGRRKTYSIAGGLAVVISRYDSTTRGYVPLQYLDPSALVALADWMRTHKPGEAVSIIDYNGHIYFEGV